MHTFVVSATKLAQICLRWIDQSESGKRLLWKTEEKKSYLLINEWLFKRNLQGNISGVKRILSLFSFSFYPSDINSEIINWLRFFSLTPALSSFLYSSLFSFSFSSPSPPSSFFHLSFSRHWLPLAPLLAFLFFLSFILIINKFKSQDCTCFHFKKMLQKEIL